MENGLKSGACMRFTNDEKQEIGKTVSHGFVQFFTIKGEVINDLIKQEIDTISFDAANRLTIRFWGYWTSIFFGDELELMFIDENYKGHFTSEDTYYNVVYEGRLCDYSHSEMQKMFVEILLLLIEAENVVVEELDTINYGDGVYRQYKPLNYTVRVKSKENNRYIKSYHNIEFRVNC